MCATAGHNDVVDVHVVLCARKRQHAIVTSDPGAPMAFGLWLPGGRCAGRGRWADGGP
jgi:hypothetical protein